MKLEFVPQTKEQYSPEYKLFTEIIYYIHKNIQKQKTDDEMFV
jgi:hypothetical protein